MIIKIEKIPNADALMNSTKCFEDKQSSIFDEVVTACNQEKVID